MSHGRLAGLCFAVGAIAAAFSGSFAYGQDPAVQPPKRRCWVSWQDGSLVSPPAAAPADPANPAPAAGGSNEDVICVDKITEADGVPVLIFVHSSNRESEAGKSSEKLNSAFDLEESARASKLFKTIKIDTEDADQELLKKYKLASVPQLIVTDDKGKVVVRQPDAKMSGNKLAKWLEDVVAKKFLEYSKKLSANKVELKKKLEEAKALMKKKEYDKAIAKFEEVLEGVPKTDTYDKAYDMVDQAKKKAKEEKEKGGK
jgi:tetratricopeptide (TPR) repeat protein